MTTRGNKETVPGGGSFCRQLAPLLQQVSGIKTNGLKKRQRVGTTADPKGLRRCNSEWITYFGT